MKELELSDAFASDETESRVENLPAVAKEAEERPGRKSNNPTSATG